MTNKVQTNGSNVNAGRGLFLLFTLYLSALAVGCASHYERGVEALEVEDYPAARSEARLGLDDDPHDGHLLSLMARALFGLSEHEAALQFAERAIATGDLEGAELGRAHAVAAESNIAGRRHYLEAALHMAAAYRLGTVENNEALRRLLWDGTLLALEAGQGADALSLARAVYRLNGRAGDVRANELVAPRIVEAAELSVHGLTRGGRHSDALVLLDELFAEFPDMVDVLLLRGLVLLRLGDGEAAESSFESFARAGSLNTAAAYQRVATALQDRQRWELAITYFQRAIATESSRSGSYRGLVGALLHTAQQDEAERVTGVWLAAISNERDLLTAWLEALTVWQSEDGEIWLRLLDEGNSRLHDIRLAAPLAAALTRRGEHERAHDVLESFVDRAPSQTDGAEEIGDWYMERHNRTLAMEYYQRAIDSAEDPAELLFKLARVHAAGGWMYEMVRALDQFVEAEGGTRAARERAWRMLSENEQWRDGARVLEPVLEEDPYNLDLVLQLGEAYFFAGEIEREEALYAETLANVEHHEEAALRFGGAFQERGAYRHALPYLNRASGSADTRLRALYELGYCHQLLDELDSMWRAYGQYMAESDDALVAGEEVLERFALRRFADLAVTLLDQLIELAPERSDLQRERLARLLVVGDWQRYTETAVSFVLTADVPLDAANDVIWMLRARVDTARRILERIMTERPDLWALNQAAGRIYLQLSREALGSPLTRNRYGATARSFYIEFLDAEGQETTDLIAAGDALLSHGMTDLAFRAYEIALRLGAPLAPIRWSYIRASIRSGVEANTLLELIQDEMDDSDDPARVARDVVGLLGEIHRVDAVLAVAESGLDRADWDPARIALYEVSAQLLVEAGLHTQLRVLSDHFVSASRDQVTALRLAALFLEQADQLDLAGEYLGLALDRVPGQADVVSALARLAFYRGEGNAEHTSASWRALWEYGTLLFEHGRFEEAASALDEAISAGADTARVFLDRSRVAARLNDSAVAVANLEEALERARSEAMTGLERVAIVEDAGDLLFLLGSPESAEAIWESMIDEGSTGRAPLRILARRALERGEYTRARQLLQTFAERDLPVDDVTALQFEFGLLEAGLEQIRTVVFEGDPEQAANLLEDHGDSIVRYLGTATLRVWVEEVFARGRTNPAPLLRLLADCYLRSGDVQAAIPILTDLAMHEPNYNLALATALAQTGQEGDLILPLRHVLTGDGSAGLEPHAASTALATAAAVGEASAVTTALQILSRDPSAPHAAALEIDWMLAHGDGAQAMNRLWALEMTGDASAWGDAVDALTRRGYLAEAAAFAEDRTSEAGEFALATIRVAFQQGRSIDSMVSRYVERASGQAGLLLVLGQTLARLGAAEQSEQVLNPLLDARYAPAERLSALSAIVRAAVSAGDEDLVERAAERFVAESNLRRRALIDVGALCEQYALWSIAVDMYRSAHRLTPRDPALTGSLLDVLFRAGQLDEMVRYAGGAHLSSLDSFRDVSLSVVAFGGGSVALPLVEALYERASSLATRDAELLAAKILLDARGADVAETRADELASFPRQELLAIYRGVRGDAPIALAMAVLDDEASTFAALQGAISLLVDNDMRSQALSALPRLVERSPSRLWGAERALLQAFELGAHALTVEIATQAIESNPTVAAPYAYRAAALALDGDTQSALLDVERFLAMSTDVGPSAEVLATALLQRGLDQMAEPVLAALTEVWRLDSLGIMVPDGWHRLMRAFAAADRAADGVAYIEEHAPGLRAYPVGLVDPEPLVSLLVAADDWEAAELVLRDALASSDSSQHLMALAAFLELREDNSEESQRLARRAWADPTFRSPHAVTSRAAVNGSTDHGIREAVRLLSLSGGKTLVQIRELLR